MALIHPAFLDCVVAIGFQDSTGDIKYCATGFLYGHFLEKLSEDTTKYSIFLVTNRHVISGQKIAHLRFNPEGDLPAKEYTMTLDPLSAGKSVCYEHPDPEVDVVVIPIVARQLRDDGIRFAYFTSDDHLLSRSGAKEAGTSEGDTVFVLGFPMGLLGGPRNYVIVRKGAIARISDCLDMRAKDFLVDCTIVPGNSGGPVVLQPEVFAITGTKSPTHSKLIGVVAGSIQYRDVAVSQQTGAVRVVFQENSGLASVIPMDFVDEIIRSIPTPVAPDATSTTGDESTPEGNPPVVVDSE